MTNKTGGPAFPQKDAVKLVNKDGTGWTASVFSMATDKPGMTLRDYFAAKAMQGALADSEVHMTHEGMARLAYRYADAMLAERGHDE